MRVINRVARPLTTALISFSIFLFAAGAARADFIVDGSFESPGVWGSSTYGNGGVPGWTSNNNQIEIDEHHTVGLGSNGAGNQSVELNGTTFDTIRQTVTGLTPGQTYLLTWQYAGRAGSGNEQMNVLFDNVLVGKDLSNGIGQMSWTQNSAVVTASATTATVQFAAVDVGGSNNVGNELDDVELNTYVPEPGTIALTLSALAMLVVCSSWRSRRRATPA